VTSTAWLFLLAAGVCAVGNWVAVARGAQRAIYLAKPATLVAVVLAALTLHPLDGAARAWFVVGFAFSLAGDVFLMLPRDAFLPGLASFLGAHLCFIAGFQRYGAPGSRLLLAAAVVAIPAAVIGGRILVALRAGGHRRTLVAVVGYMLALSAMVCFALASGRPAAMAGGSLFYASDAMIAWDRFVKRRRSFALAIIVTYHLAQAGLLLSLVQG